MRLNGSPARPVRLRLDGVSRHARFETLEENGETTSYFLGADQSKWVRDVPHHRKLAWRGVYPGVDVLFYGTDARLEYDFVLAPGADPSRLRMKIDGATRVESTADGGIVMHAGTERFEMRAPKVYQGAESVEARYRLHGSTVTFEVGDYDRSRALVVDPVVYTTYGGENDDSVVAVTSKGDVVGVTSSASYTGSIEKRGRDVFVMTQPLTPGYRGPRLVIAGGSDDDVPTCADVFGNYIVVGGWTRSSDLVRNEPAQGVDGFLIWFYREAGGPAGITRIAGSGDDRVWALTGSYFAGETSSPDLKATGSLHGATDGFFGYALLVGQTPMSLSYWGGSGDDAIYAIQVEANGLLFGGRTTSTDLEVVNAPQPQPGGGADGFFVRTGTPPVVTYVGGSGDDAVRAVGVQTYGITYFLAGTTSSKDLPVVNAAQPAYGGGETDGLLARVDVDRSAYGFLTYIGGSGRDEVAAMMLPVQASIRTDPVLAGTTTSADPAGAQRRAGRTARHERRFSRGLCARWDHGHPDLGGRLRRRARERPADWRGLCGHLGRRYGFERPLAGSAGPGWARRFHRDAFADKIRGLAPVRERQPRRLCGPGIGHDHVACAAGQSAGGDAGDVDQRGPVESAGRVQLRRAGCGSRVAAHQYCGAE